MPRQDSFTGHSAFSDHRDLTNTPLSPPDWSWPGIFKCNCKVTIAIRKRARAAPGTPEIEELHATRFEFIQNRCLFTDAAGDIVLEQRFVKDPRSHGIYPWRKAGRHHELLVTFAKEVKALFEIYVDNVRLVSELPKYQFFPGEGYAEFQTQLRGRGFVTEFETKEIITKHFRGDNRSTREVIKIWDDFSSGHDLSVTLPIVRGANNTMQFPELSFRWFRCETSGTSQTKLKLILHEQKSNTASPKLSPLRRASMVIRSKSAQASPKVEPTPMEPVLEHMRTEYGQFDITFTSTEDRNRFRDLHEGRSTISGSPAASPGNLDQSLSILPLSPSTRNPSSTSSLFSRLPPFDTPASDNTAESSYITKIPSITIPPPQVGPEGSPPPMSPAERSFLACATTTSLPAFELPPPLVDDGGREFQRQGGPSPANALQASGYFRENAAVYEPLRPKQIRLLTIKKGFDADPLLCQLDAIDLEDSPSYEAVSYCWGWLDERPESIMIGNRQSLKVTQHLCEGLRRLRFNNANRVVWIDAVCINQANIDEKNHQIPMMKDIYGRAHRTLIWIGNLTMNEDNCQRIGRAQGDSKTSELTLCHNSELETVVHGTAANLERTLKAYADEVRRNHTTDVWWKRLWCIQEYYLSALRPVVYVGPHSINWSKFAEILGKPQGPANPLALFRQLSTPQRHSLFSLLCSAGSFHCGDLRDRIYGLLSMVSVHDPTTSWFEGSDTYTRNTSPVLVPDYGKSVLYVLEETCMYLIEESQSLDVLLDGRVDRRKNGQVGLINTFPSWMPDLTSLIPPSDVRLQAKKAGLGEDERLPIVRRHQLSGPVAGYDVPSLLRVRGIRFERIVRRTICEDFLCVESSPSGSLVYNSLKRRGHLLDKILNTLEYDHTKPSKFGQLERRPYLSLLMLDYVFEEKRSFIDEIRKGLRERQDNVVMSYEDQRDKDLIYVRGNRADEYYVRDRWSTKIINADAEVFVPERLTQLLRLKRPDRESIWNDFETAREFENLFAYARTTDKKYYFTKDDFDAPMRSDVLACSSIEEVRKLPSRHKSGDADPEFHEYNAKNRERDFFITEGGFIGLGPSVLDVDDLVIVPLGSSVPWILRPNGTSANGDQIYTLVGETNIPSIMAGALLVESRSQEEDFLLI